MLTARSTAQLFLEVFFSLREMESKCLFSGTSARRHWRYWLALLKGSMHPKRRVSASVVFLCFPFRNSYFDISSNEMKKCTIVWRKAKCVFLVTVVPWNVQVSFQHPPLTHISKKNFECLKVMEGKVMALCNLISKFSKPVLLEKYDMYWPYNEVTDKQCILPEVLL